MIEFRIALSFGRLRFAPVDQRLTVYTCIQLGRRRYWAQWWDTGRCRGNRLRAVSRDGLMCLTSGISYA